MNVIRERDSEINLLERKVKLLGMKPGNSGQGSHVEVKVTKDREYE